MNYKKNYYDYIDYVKTLNRSKNDSVYYEKHHIIPKSLGGTDSKDNLVLLTAREHYLAHYLLCKFTEGPAKRSMFWAFHRMTYSDASHTGKRQINSSRLYEYLRSEFILQFKSDEFRRIKSEQTKDRVWVSDGHTTKMIKNNELENFLINNPTYSLGRKGFKIKTKNRKKTIGSKHSPEKIGYWMYNPDELKDKMVKKAEIQHYEDLGWKRGRYHQKKPTTNPKVAGTIWIVKDGVEQKIKKEDLDTYISDGWVRGRKTVSNETKEKMSKSHSDPNGKTQILLNMIRNGEIKMYHPKNVTLYKDGIYKTVDTNKIDIEPFLIDGWIKKGKPKSDEWKEKMSKAMMGNTNGFKKSNNK